MRICTGGHEYGIKFYGQLKTDFFATLRAKVESGTGGAGGTNMYGANEWHFISESCYVEESNAHGDGHHVIFINAGLREGDVKFEMKDVKLEVFGKQKT